MYKIKNLLLVEKRVGLQDYQVIHFVNGLIKATSNFIKQKQVKDFIVLNVSKNLLMVYLMILKRQMSFTVELVQVNKKMTLLDKLNSSNIDILLMKLYRIVLPVSTLKEKDYKPFWNEQYKALSEKLWLPTEIGYPDLHLISLNGLLNREMVKSSYWMKTYTNPQNRNLQKICCPSFISTHVDKWEGEDIKLKTLKIQLMTSSKQKQILQDWMNTTRYVYNRTINAITKENQKVNFFDLRNKLVIAKNNNLADWELKTPKDVRAGAVKDVITSYKSAFTNLKQGNISDFKIGYKSKKSKSDVLTIPKTAIKIVDNGINIYPSYIKDIITYNVKRNKLPEKIEHDCKIVKQNKQYQLLIPIPCKKVIKETTNFISGDLGTRTFLTCYNNDNILEFHRDKQLIKKLTNKIDSMKSNRKKKKIWKVESKIKNIISDLHWKTVVHLTDNYDTIFMGKLESQKCAQQSKNHKLNRDLNIFSHYKFLEKLRYLCNAKHRNLVMVNEAFTSQTCPKCSNLTKTINKLWTCNNLGPLNAFLLIPP